MTIKMCSTNFIILLITNTLLVGCAQQGGVMPVNIYDKDAHAIYGQVRVTTESGRKFQFELEQYQAEDELPLDGAMNNSGQGEYRLRDGAVDIANTTLLVGPATVESSHKVTQLSAQIDFSWVDSRYFHLGWAPHLSYLTLESDYRIPGQSFNIDLQEPGIGAQINAEFLLHQQWSLHANGKLTSFSSDTKNITYNTFARFQPTSRLNIDLGVYVAIFYLSTDTGIIYEQRTATNNFCYENCSYEYNNNSKSTMMIDTKGYRLGFGWSF